MTNIVTKFTQLVVSANDADTNGIIACQTDARVACQTLFLIFLS